VKVVILCGGKGVRAYPLTEVLPKPMLPVDGSPILIHLIRGFIAQGFRQFVLAAGHRKNVIDDYFYRKDLGAEIEIVDTGSDRGTGGRLAACRDYLGQTFVATYGDGLSDVPMPQVAAFHHAHGGLATVSVTPLRTQYGVLESDLAGRVTSMREKPVMNGHWINIGFMVLEKAVLDRYPGDNLEQDVLPALVADNQLYMYRHDGFFRSMDNYKDQQELEDLVHSGQRPWPA